jgi:hypothetical protein
MNRVKTLLSIALSLNFACIAYAQSAPPAKPAGPALDYVNMPFRGTFREFPKTHYATSAKGQVLPVEVFSDLDALSKILPPDDAMRKKYAKELGQSWRFPEEQRNVSVVGYIHAVKLDYGIDSHGVQGDQDFHVMLGTSPKRGEGRFFTASVSGLPRDGFGVKNFMAARQQLLQLLLRVARTPESSFRAAFAPIDPPLRVKVTGSLLFDGRQPASAGPDYAKAATVWHIHPVMSIDQQ